VSVLQVNLGEIGTLGSQIVAMKATGVIRMGDRLTVGDGGMVRPVKQGETTVGIALESSIPDGCLGVTDERRGLRWG
jgi:hypothetical protein